MLKSPEIKMYTQMKRQPLPKMFKGKALLIGDACHPMLLTHAQGVSSSIEDSAALEVLFSNIPASTSVSAAPSATLIDRLELFEKFRLPRVSATQIMTDPIPPGPKAAELQAKMEVEIRKYYDGPLPPSNSVPHSPAICDFFFGYDVTAEAEKVLATHHINALEKEVSGKLISSATLTDNKDTANRITAPEAVVVTAPAVTAADKTAETNVS
jgi:salicylate hydroxylase